MLPQKELDKIHKGVLLEEAAMAKISERTRGKAINIIFDGPPSHESGRFVEVETDDGASINAGKWSKREDGLWSLRITELPSGNGDLPTLCCFGPKHSCKLNVNDGYCCAIKCQFQVCEKLQKSDEWFDGCGPSFNK